MEDNNLETRTKEWLQEEIKKYCNDAGMLELYWDYQDREALDTAVTEYLEDYDGGDVVEYLIDCITEEDWYPDWCMQSEDEFFLEIENDAERLEDEDIKEYIDTLSDDIVEFKEMLFSVGYNGIDDGLKGELSRIKLNVNLTLATPDEANFDMSSVIVAFGTDYLSPELETMDIKHLNNAITYLIHQQGYTLKELYDRLLTGKDGGKLINSIAEEIQNVPAEATSGLTVLVSVNPSEYNLLFNTDYVEVSTDTEIGIYNSWIGGGSIFGIALEEPFVFPTSMILHADFDNVTGSGAYSVGDCYGTMGEDRSGNIRPSGAPTLQDEDLQEVLDYIRITYGNGEEVEESKQIKNESKEDLDKSSKEIYKQVIVTFECDDCGHKEDWTFDDMAEWRLAYLEASDSNNEVGDCPECGSMYYNMKDYKIIEENKQ